jgi:response regulator RpfG family c-di-GMP phosphodiesterase
LHWLVNRAKRGIAAESGVSFDPDIVRAFEASVEAMVNIKLSIDGAAPALECTGQPALAS